MINRSRLFGLIIGQLANVGIMSMSRVNSSAIFITTKAHRYVVVFSSDGVELIDTKTTDEVLYITVSGKVNDFESYATDKIYLKILEMENSHE